MKNGTCKSGEKEPTTKKQGEKMTEHQTYVTIDNDRTDEPAKLEASDDNPYFAEIVAKDAPGTRQNIQASVRDAAKLQQKSQKIGKIQWL